MTNTTNTSKLTDTERADLITSCQGLVVTLARRWRWVASVDFLDLIQEGNIGLLVALDKFDPSRGCKFSSFAFNYIRQAIKSAVVVDYRGFQDNVEFDETFCGSVVSSQETAKDLDKLDAAINTLTYNEQAVIRDRLADKTFEEISLNLGCSRQRVDQIEKKAISRLRKKVCRI